MDLLDNVITGFSVALQWHNVLFCFIGVLIGTQQGAYSSLAG